MNLRLNPSSRLTVDHTKTGRIRTVSVVSPLKGRFCTNTIFRGSEGENILLLYLEHLKSDNLARVAPENDILKDCGLLVRPNEISNAPLKPFAEDRELSYAIFENPREEQIRAMRFDKFLVLPRFFSESVTHALAAYYKKRADEGFMFRGDIRTPDCLWEHNETLAKEMHPRFTRFVSKLVGKDMKPSYCYLSRYLGGSELPIHMDRRQCEVSISILIEHTKGNETEFWPIYLRDKNVNQDFKIVLKTGDALALKGRAIPHYRTRLPANETYTVLIFHFVGSNFRGKLG